MENASHSLGASSAHSGRAVGMAMLVTASVLWSLAGIAVKLARMDDIAFACYRSAAACVPLAILALIFRGGLPPARWMLFSSVLYTAVVSLFIVSMTRSTAATGILLQYTSPVWCALFAWLFQGRRVSRRTMLAMGIALAGVGVMVVTQKPGAFFGAMCGLLSGVAFGALILVLERINRETKGRPNVFFIVLMNNLGAMLILLAIGLYRGLPEIDARQSVIVVATGVIQLAAPYVMFQLSLRKVQPVDASLLILLEPVLNPIWVAMFTSERPDLGTIVGGVAILLALVVEATKGDDPEENARPQPAAEPRAAPAPVPD